MGGNYGKSIYNQLMEVMGRLDSVEKELQSEKKEHEEDSYSSAQDFAFTAKSV